MGQGLTVSDNNGKPVSLKPVDKLAFANGDLFAYDYLYEEQSAQTDKDIQATFKLKMPGRDSIFMNMWMKGAPGREIFSVKSPKSTAIDRGIVPKEIAELPLPTIVARQYGEAWTKPFVAVFEPASEKQPASVVSIAEFSPAKAPADFAGVIVENKNGSTQTIFSASAGNSEISYKEVSFRGSYAVISEYNHEIQYLFLGNGRKLSKGGFGISTAADSASAVLCKQNGQWFLACTKPVTLTLPQEAVSKSPNGLRVNGKTVTGIKKVVKGKTLVTYNLPVLPYTRLDL
jgi:hypothetical protein